MDAKTYLDLVSSRYSTRKFTDEQLTDDELATLLEAARLAPSAKNTQPLRLCVVQSPEGLAKINECTKCHYNAPTVLIAAYDKTVSSKGMGVESGDFGDIDVSIALTNLENAAAAMGLGSCWIGAYDPQAVRARFNVPEHYQLVELFMVGHSAMEPSPRHFERQPLDALVVRETF